MFGFKEIFLYYFYFYLYIFFSQGCQVSLLSISFLLGEHRATSSTSLGAIWKGSSGLPLRAGILQVH